MGRTEWERGEQWDELSSERRLAEQNSAVQSPASYAVALTVAGVLIALWMLHACVPWS